MPSSTRVPTAVPGSTCEPPRDGDVRRDAEQGGGENEGDRAMSWEEHLRPNERGCVGESLGTEG